MEMNNEWIIDDDFELSEETLSIEDMLKQRKRIKLLAIDDGVTDEEFDKIISRMRNKEE